MLGIARRICCDFDSPDLELCFLKAMDNSGTIKLDESNFDREINSDKPVLVDFWAEWCGPCKLIAPLLDEIAREKADAIKVAKVNVDENQSLSFKYNIRAIPSLLFFKNGQLRDQVTGMTSKKDLLSRLEALA
jgi:thioredoxin 1